MIPLHKGVFFSCIFPSRKINWDYHPFNWPLFWFHLRFYAWII